MNQVLIRLAIAVAILPVSLPVHAYVGPGAGLSAIGIALALIGAMFLMIAGFVWYPVKRLLKRREKQRVHDATEPEASDAEDPELPRDLDPVQSERT
jgi:type VI protein secretion system component VasK